MAEKLNIDNYGRVLITEQDICKKLYTDPNFNFNGLAIDSAEKYNSAVENLYLTDFYTLTNLEHIDSDPVSWHKKNQMIWFMSDFYKQFDIAAWLLDQCKNDVELQRTGKELLLFAERDMLDLLRYLKYLVDTMRSHNIVWGVGRGSSVASFVLYLIGVHKVNSITYNLDIEEFIR